jgi:hypothetical protein
MSPDSVSGKPSTYKVDAQEKDNGFDEKRQGLEEHPVIQDSH